MEKDSKYTEEELKVMAEFEGYMAAAIEKLSRNVTRKAYRAERRLCPLDQMKEEEQERYLSRCDKYGIEGEIRIVVKGQCYSLCSDTLKNLLDGLSRREQESIVLHDAFGFTYREIGALLDISCSRAKDYRFQGMKKIRRKLKVGGEKTQDRL